MRVEREIKLSVPDDFTFPDVQRLGIPVRSTPERRFQTVYLDTDDLRLARWGLSLRFREGEGWTLKVPRAGQGASLERAEITIVGGPGRPPPGITNLVAGVTRRAPLRRVARLSTVRRAYDALGLRGQRIGTIVDDEVEVIEGPGPRRFRQLEVEVSDEAADAPIGSLVRKLRRAGASYGDGRSKYLIALGAEVPPEPEIPVVQPGPDARTGELIRWALAASVVRLIRSDPGVRIGVDPEDVHQARVATRRLRSDLRTFHVVLDETWCDPLRQELAWLGRALGEVRDLDVRLDRLDGMIPRLQERDRNIAGRLRRDLLHRREGARARLAEVMDSARYVELLERLVDAARSPAVRAGVGEAAARETLAGVMDRPWRKLRNAVEGLGEAPTDAALHRVRILCKRARYAAEALEPVFGRRAEAFARRAARLQDILGDHQDAVLAHSWLRTVSAGSPRRAFVAGQLAMLELELAEESRRAWPAAWRTLARKDMRFWG